MQKNYSRIGLSCALLAVLFVFLGCSVGLTNEEIKSKLIEANSNLKSYSFNMKMTTGMKMDVLGSKTSAASEMTGNGDIDRQNKKMFLKLKINSDMGGFKNELETEAYFIGDFMYTKVFNNWVKSKVEKGMWDQQDQIAQLIELMQSGTIERLKDESFNGNSYYVIKSNPDIKKLIGQILKQQQSDLQEDFNYNDMIKSFSFTLWINKKTFVIEKSKTDMKMSVPSGIGGRGDAEVDFSIELSMSNINKAFSIVLPADANKAVDYSSGFMQPRGFGDEGLAEEGDGEDAANLLPEKCIFSPGFTCTNFKMSTSDVKFTARNALGSEIKVKSVEFTTNDGKKLNCVAPSDLTTSVWNAGEGKDFAFTNCNGLAAGLEKGNKEKLEVKLSYEVIETGITRSVYGSVFGKVE